MVLLDLSFVVSPLVDEAVGVVTEINVDGEVDVAWVIVEKVVVVDCPVLVDDVAR